MNPALTALCASSHLLLPLGCTVLLEREHTTEILVGDLPPPSPERPHPGPRKKARQASSPQGKERLSNHQGGAPPQASSWGPVSGSSEGQLLCQALCRLGHPQPPPGLTHRELRTQRGPNGSQPGTPASLLSPAHRRRVSTVGAACPTLLEAPPWGNWGPMGTHKGGTKSHLPCVSPGNAEQLKVSSLDQEHQSHLVCDTQSPQLARNQSLHFNVIPGELT